MKLIQTGPFSFEIKPIKRNLENFKNHQIGKKQKNSNFDFSLKTSLLSSSNSSDSSGCFSQISEMSIDEDLLKSFHYPDFEPIKSEEFILINNSDIQNEVKNQENLLSSKINLSNVPQSKLSLNAQRFSIESILSSSHSANLSKNKQISNSQTTKNSRFIKLSPNEFKKKTKIILENGRQVFQCCFCPKVFSNNSNWRRHENLHGRGGIQECSICGKTFMQKEYLKKHMVTHTRKIYFIEAESFKIHQL
ncbi:hypothetical protein PVAND_017407 [Polypedilum vanderplanki]|uniref:C2H2-type domain-containing protein n=1 Tax=Polypedilum vanderplanki TaxID=319348 RepID=A0A9J6BIK9_POLVA|nr:hypothetical protein PVAND_017407 [Polypedilum vanderplanki]